MMSLDAASMQILEGQLLKYTNVVKGWQYRWFVLTPECGTLSYFMERGCRVRGQIDLTGAVVAPSDEDSHTFSVNGTSGEVFRLRASHARERQQWVDKLRTVIQLHNRVHTEKGLSVEMSSEVRDTNAVSDTAALDHHTGPSLSVLSSLHDAHTALKDTNAQFQSLTRAVRELPDHAGPDVKLTNTDSDLLLLRATSQSAVLCLEQCYWILQQIRLAADSVTNMEHSSLPHQSALSGHRDNISQPAARAKPDKDFLSDVADWFDQNFGVSKTVKRSQSTVCSQRRNASNTPISAVPAAAAVTHAASALPDTAGSSVEVSLDDESELAEVACDTVMPVSLPASDQQQQCVWDEAVRTIIAPLKLGSELTQVSLPAHLLQPLSLLELLAHFAGARCDVWLRLAAQSGSITALQRMCLIVQWYVGGWLNVGRYSAHGKPYNPVLGEMFRCSYSAECSGDDSTGSDSTSGENLSRMRVLCEQVSHHPPVSAMFAESDGGALSLQLTLGCRVPYIGCGVNVNLAGDGRVLLRLPTPPGAPSPSSETYSFNLPVLHVRSLFGTAGRRRAELRGQVVLSCAESRYTTTLNFQSQMNSGETVRQRLSGEIRGPENESVVRLTSDCDQLICFQSDQRTWTLPCRASKSPQFWLRPQQRQDNHESRRVWSAMTSALLNADWSAANREKERVEREQRARAGHGHIAKHFYRYDGVWVFKNETSS